MRPPIKPVLGVCLVVALSAGGCGSSTPGGTAANSSPLMQALAMVRASATSRTSFAWSDMAAVRQYAGYPSQASRLAKAKIKPRWEGVFGIGTDGLAALEPPITGKTGVDFFAAQRATQIGTPPNVAMRIDGPQVDPAAITRALKADGAKQRSVDGRKFLAIGAERSANLSSPLALLGVINQLDRSVAQGHTFAAGSAVAPVADLLGGSPSLASDSAHQAAAGCLGDVVTAEISAPAEISAQGSSATLVAIGDRRPASGSAPVTDVLCLIDAASSAAQRQSAHLRSVLSASGQIPNYPLSSGDVVRSLHVSQTREGRFTVLQALIGLQPGQAAGFLDQIANHGAMGGLVGG